MGPADDWMHAAYSEEILQWPASQKKNCSESSARRPVSGAQGSVGGPAEFALELSEFGSARNSRNSEFPYLDYFWSPEVARAAGGVPPQGGRV